MPTQPERTEATRAALISAARVLFGARGYAGVGTEEIVAAAGVTRGALYHHFRDKRALFRAVFVVAEQDFVQRVAERVVAAERPVDQILAALDAALEAFADEEVARISFLDGPAVLGFEDWRAIVEEHSLGLLVAMLAHAMDAGELRPSPPEPLAHLVLGALTEAGMVIASGGDREAMTASLQGLVEGLRA